ncbi:hypothetical protein GCM10026983_24380 [Gracilibacillus alcaliphilus]
MLTYRTTLREVALVAGRSELDVAIRLQIVIHKRVFYNFLDHKKRKQADYSACFL